MSSWGHLRSRGLGLNGLTLVEILTVDACSSYSIAWHGYIVTRKPKVSHSNKRGLA